MCIALSTAFADTPTPVLRDLRELGRPERTATGRAPSCDDATDPHADPDAASVDVGASGVVLST